jgi:hypothetical protein
MEPGGQSAGPKCPMVAHELASDAQRNRFYLKCRTLAQKYSTIEISK